MTAMARVASKSGHFQSYCGTPRGHVKSIQFIRSPALAVRQCGHELDLSDSWKNEGMGPVCAHVLRQSRCTSITCIQLLYLFTALANLLLPE